MPTKSILFGALGMFLLGGTAQAERYPKAKMDALAKKLSTLADWQKVPANQFSKSGAITIAKNIAAKLTEFRPWIDNNVDYVLVTPLDQKHTLSTRTDVMLQRGVVQRTYRDGSYLGTTIVYPSGAKKMYWQGQVHFEPAP